MKKTIFILIAVTLLFSGCYPRGSLGATELYNVAEVVESATPFGMGWLESSDFPTLLESDKNGRELYEYRSPYYRHLIIIQKTEEPFVWYYTDFCYLTASIQSEKFSEEEITWLKEVNDWDKELVPDKMSSLNYKDGIPDIEERFALEDEICKYFGVNDEDVEITMDGMERDALGKQIVRVTINNGSDLPESFKAYVILSGYENGKHIIHVSEEISPDLDCREDVRIFRDKYWDKGG